MNKKILLTIIMLFTVLTMLFSSLTYTVNAALFDEEQIICIPDWYCTTYSQSGCGNRVCVDINTCGYNFNKPQELTPCESSSNIIPQGYFTTNTEIIKLSVGQKEVTQKIITINSSIPEDYTLEILYPSSYTKGTDFFTTSNNNKRIETIGDFNIILDARNIVVGTYVVPIKIYNKDYAKIIIVIVDVIPENNPKIELELDSQVKTLGLDKGLNTELNVKGAKLVVGDNLTYTILDPKGNIIFEQDRIIEDSSNIKETIPLPTDATEGYYTLSVKIENAQGTYTKSAAFTTLTQDKYNQIVDKKQKRNYTALIIIIIIAVLIIVGLVLMVFNTRLLYKSRKFSRRYKYSRGINSKGITLFKFSIKRPLIQINLDAKEGLKKLSEKFKAKEEDLSSDKKLALLKKSYERGFISLKEYRDALKNQGFSVESERIGDYYEELKNKEKVEDLKHEREIEQKEIQRISSEQKKEMEKAEAAVLKQEEELKKELEREEKLRREAEERERLSKELMLEEAKKEANVALEHKDEIKEEVKVQTEPIGITTSTEKVIINPMSHIISKENILDRRIMENQSFGLNNNEKLYCLRDLLNALPNMPEYILDHHTKQGRNDFANWIGDVFQYYDVAEEVRKATNRDDLIKVLKKYE